MNAVDRTLRTFYALEKGMPPWLKRTWTVYLVWMLVVTLSAYGVLCLFQIVATRPVEVRYGRIARAEKTEGDFHKKYRAIEEDGVVKIVVEEQQYLGPGPHPPQ